MTILDIPITTALTRNATTFGMLGQQLRGVTLDMQFVYGSGGTTCTAWVQTSFDGGLTWVDVAVFLCLLASRRRIVNLRRDVSLSSAYLPTDGTLSGDESAIDGLLGEQWRVLVTSTGTYGGSTQLTLFAHPSY